MDVGPSRRARGRVAFVGGLNDILLIGALVASARAAVALTLSPFLATPNLIEWTSEGTL